MTNGGGLRDTNAHGMFRFDGQHYQIPGTKHGPATADRRVAAVERVVLAGLEPTERALIQKLTHRAASRIHAEDPDADPCTVVREALDQPG